jgi:hypothetical protein
MMFLNALKSYMIQWFFELIEMFLKVLIRKKNASKPCLSIDLFVWGTEYGKDN